MPGVGRAYKKWGVADIGNGLTKRRGATYDEWEKEGTALPFKKLAKLQCKMQIVNFKMTDICP